MWASHTLIFIILTMLTRRAYVHNAINNPVWVMHRYDVSKGVGRIGGQYNFTICSNVPTWVVYALQYEIFWVYRHISSSGTSAWTLTLPLAFEKIWYLAFAELLLIQATLLPYLEDILPWADMNNLQAPTDLMSSMQC